MMYGVPFRWKDKKDWIPIYALTEEGEYSVDPLVFSMELSDEEFKDDLENYINYPEGRRLNNRYNIFKHQASGMFFIGDREHFRYLAEENWTKISQPSLRDYQNLIVFLNRHGFMVNFEEIGMYLINDSFSFII